ncbi:MAG: hypothetical protein ACTHQE_01800 [Thermomicrobiales bacterium]
MYAVTTTLSRFDPDAGFSRSSCRSLRVASSPRPMTPARVVLAAVQ